MRRCRSGWSFRSSSWRCTLSHFTLLRLPYYWDEAGYYIPAAWDFFRTGSLIPTSTLTNAHPPLPSIYLALCWKASGFHPEVTREAVLLVATLGLLAVWRLAMRLVGVASVAFWTVLLTGLYPIWFAQSSLAHADIFAAACSLWGLVYALPNRSRTPWAAALWFAAAALSKETAIVIPLTLAAVNLAVGFRSGGPVRSRLWREAAWLSSCVVPLAAWYAYHYAKTGFLFGNPEFLRYNAEATLTPLRILAAFGHRILHLTAHMNLFVPVLMAFAALLLKPAHRSRGTRAGVARFAGAAAHIFSSAGQRGVVQRIRRRTAHALSAAHVSAGAAIGRVHVVPPRALLVRADAAGGRGVRCRALRESALRVCAGRQPGVRARDSHAPGRHCAAQETLSRRDGADGVAHERRTDAARTGLRENSRGRCSRSTTLPPARLHARPRSRRSIRRRWCFPPSTIRRCRCQA